jgi:hypothetical protein
VSVGELVRVGVAGAVLAKFADGGAVEGDELPDAKDDAEADGKKHEDEAGGAEGFGLLREKPVESGGAQGEGREEAEDTPDDAGAAGAVAAEDDARADADHDDVPDEGQEEREGIGGRRELNEDDGAGDDEQGGTEERAEG